MNLYSMSFVELHLSLTHASHCVSSICQISLHLSLSLLISNQCDHNLSKLTPIVINIVLHSFINIVIMLDKHCNSLCPEQCLSKLFIECFVFVLILMLCFDLLSHSNAFHMLFIMFQVSSFASLVPLSKCLFFLYGHDTEH